MRGELSTQDNQWECSRTLSSDLGFSSGTELFQVLANPTPTPSTDPIALRNKFQVIYIAPGVSSTDYTYLQRMVAPGGVIDRFVSLGGVAVINTAGLPADQGQVAPAGVTLATATAHNSEEIAAPDHPYITGLGYGGNLLGTADFDNWGPTQPTDLGTLELTNLAATPTTVLAHAGDQATWVEYRHGEGRVIVTTLSYCWAADPSVLTPSQRAATANLLRYGSFFSGSAFTPAPTVTATGSPTPTFTPRFRTPTPTPVRTGSPTPTATATPTPPCPGDCTRNGVVTVDEILSAVNIALGHAQLDACTPADTNRDGQITIEEILAAIDVALHGCPSIPAG